MTTERKREANRKNARKSTGPRSPQGKAKASRNALRHGFSAHNNADQQALELVRRIAEAICDDASGPVASELATVIADAQVSIARVRAARITAIREARVRIIPSDPIGILLQTLTEGRDALVYGDTAGFKRSTTKLGRAVKAFRKAKTGIVLEKTVLQETRDDLDSLCIALPELVALERYERRAISRRRRAIQRLYAIRYVRHIQQNSI